MKWTDLNDIALALIEQHPEVNPLEVSFPQLYRWVLALPGFNDDPERCGERILEAIQATWIEEAQ